MANLFKNKAKLILIIYIIILAILLVFGLFFMTNYLNVHIAYSRDTEGFIEITERSRFQSELITNENLFKYFAQASDMPDTLSNVAKSAFGGYIDECSEEALAIYNMHNQLNGVNNYIVVTSIVSIALCAVFFIFSNNNRRIYYKSNLYVGILVPLVISVLSIVGIVLLISAMSSLSADLDLYKVASAMTKSNSDDYVAAALTDWSVVEANSSSVNVITMVVGIIINIVVLVYSAFVAIFTMRKYKSTGKEREEIISRAVTAND